MAGRMKNSNYNIGNRTRELSFCSVVPQLTAPPRASGEKILTGENRSTGMYISTSLCAFVVQRGPTLRYGSTLLSTSALDGVGGQRHAPAALLREGDLIDSS